MEQHVAHKQQQQTT